MDNRLTDAALGAIQNRAFWAAYYARDLENYIRLLPLRPDYRTLAESAINDAEKKLSDAIDAVRAAKAAYQAIPVEHLEAAE